MAKANGKIILLGEHAVVYGVPAIAAGIERGARAEADTAEQAELLLAGQRVTPTDGSDVGRAFGALLGALNLPPVRVRVELELPAGAGLGASAALGVAIARAALNALGEPESRERVLRAADAWERVFHGNPSGVDAAAAVYGGCLIFSKRSGIEPLTLPAELALVIAIAGPPASTKDMVEGVARLRERRPELVEKTLAGIDSLVSNARSCLLAGDHAGLGKLMDLNQMLLSGLFVSTESIERACETARAAGALGAKLTGSGGGGAVIALCRETEPVRAALSAAGFDAFATRVAGGSA